MKNYKTPLAQKIKELESEGFTTQYKFENNSLINLNKGYHYNPDEIRLVHEYRFEGESNPADMSILYVIEGKNGDKGTIVNAYGTYANEELDHYINQVDHQ